MRTMRTMGLMRLVSTSIRFVIWGATPQHANHFKRLKNQVFLTLLFYYTIMTILGIIEGDAR